MTANDNHLEAINPLPAGSLHRQVDMTASMLVVGEGVGSARFGLKRDWYGENDLVTAVQVSASGQKVPAGAALAILEVSTKHCDDVSCRYETWRVRVLAPLPIEVTETNAALLADPILIQEDPEETGWLLRADVADE